MTSRKRMEGCGVPFGETGGALLGAPASRRLFESPPGAGSGPVVDRREERVYAVRMPRVNVYLPDSLAQEAKAAGLNVSKLTQEALKAALDADRTTAWLGSVAALGATRASHEDVVQAVREAKSDFET